MEVQQQQEHRQEEVGHNLLALLVHNLMEENILLEVQQCIEDRECIMEPYHH